jgi:hypothetical protein
VNCTDDKCVITTMSGPYHMPHQCLLNLVLPQKPAKTDHHTISDAQSITDTDSKGGPHEAVRKGETPGDPQRKRRQERQSVAWSQEPTNRSDGLVV